MPIPSEIRENLPKRLAALNLSISDLADFSGISRPVISSFLSGAKNISFADSQQLERVTQELERVQAMAGPIPINFRDKKGVRALIQQIAEGHFPLGDDPDRAFIRLRITLAAWRASEGGSDAK